VLAIENEIKLSQSQVDTVLSRHMKAIEYFENNYDKEEKTLAEEIVAMGGIQAPSIKNISLRFFISNKAELLTFELISQLSEIETFKNTLSEKLKRLIDYSYDHMNNNDSETKIKFTYLLANVIDSEEALLRLYAEFIEENGVFIRQKGKQSQG
jgi:hypothetical protein